MKLLHGQGEIIAERYQIVTLLGQGGMGSSYAAVDLKTNQRVAIKVVSLREARDWKTLELFEREAQVLATLNHPFIPKYLDYFQLDVEEKDSTNSDCRFYLVQELVEGDSLATLVERGWEPKEAEVEEIALQVLDILVYLHTLLPPIIHRDIKPQNLIRREDGKVYLVDFGTVQHIVRNPQSFASTFVGSVGYMPPEQLRGQTVFASDLYSLGATLIFLLTSQSPETLPQKMLKVDFRKAIKLSDGFARWLDGLIEPIIEDRFQSAQEAVLKLKQIKQLVIPANQTISHSHKLDDNTRIKFQQSNHNLVVQIDCCKLDSSLGYLGAYLMGLSLITSGAFMIFKDALELGINIKLLSAFLIMIGMFFAVNIFLKYALDLGKKTELKINSETFEIQWNYLSIWKPQVQGKTGNISKLSQNGKELILWEGTRPHKLIDELLPGSWNRLVEITSTDIEWLSIKTSNFINQLHLESANLETVTTRHKPTYIGNNFAYLISTFILTIFVIFPFIPFSLLCLLFLSPMAIPFFFMFKQNN